MKTFVRSAAAVLFLALAVLFLPSSGMTVSAKTYSAGEEVNVTSLQVKDVLEIGVKLRCPDTHALSLYVDGIHKAATNPYTTQERYWVEQEANHDNAVYWLKVSTWFPKVSGVSLDKDHLTMTVGDTDSLTATVTPDNASDRTVRWSVSPEGIVSVENGQVTALAEGTATVTVTTNSGGYTASCTVTVCPHVSGVTLAPSTLSMKVGDAPVALTATVSPANALNKAVTWSSSVPSVAAVDENGNVTAASVGTATVTATTEDGGFTAACEVAVIQPVTGVTLAPSTLAMKVGDAPVALTATVLPAEADDKTVTWSSSAPSVAAVDENGMVTATAAGTATVTVTTNDGGFTASCEVTVTQPVTGVTLEPSELSLYVGGAAETLTATVSPASSSDKTVRWTSSDENVALVDENGSVTANGEGSAEITVTTIDGGFTASCTVNVFDPATATLKVIKGDNQTYQGEALPFTFRFIEDTGDIYDYLRHFAEATLQGDDFAERALTSGEATAEKGSLLVTVETGILSTLQPGTYTLTVSLDSGKSATAVFTVPQSVPDNIVPPATGDNGIGILAAAWLLFLLSLAFMGAETTRLLPSALGFAGFLPSTARLRAAFRMNMQNRKTE